MLKCTKDMLRAVGQHFRFSQVCLQKQRASHPGNNLNKPPMSLNFLFMRINATDK